MQLEKVYEPGRFEPRWAERWVEEGLFVASADSDRPSYSLVAPPPNVTGALHVGHLFEIAMTDIAIRWRRMRGDATLWLPGVDHAGIATQMLVERALREEGVDRRELGREKFLERVWEWKEKYGGAIVGQLKRIGASCDWSRQRFTMDADLSRAVREAFVRLWEKGLLYRGEYLVNWCPRCLTALSDLEVVHSEQQGSLWHIRYPVEGSDDSVVVATTRPETMLGDTAVAVNEADERYKRFWGKKAILPLVGRKLPFILDELADPEFGTGVVKVTPAHDPNDFAAGKRHDLEFLTVIDEEARMAPNAGEFAGLDRYEARRRIVAALEEQGLIEKIEDYTNNVGSCQRCKTVVEPRISIQWFVKTKPLAEKAVEAVENGSIEIVPEQWRRNYFEWMRNIRDWCVSRQLWWGHRIPAWYCADCGETVVARVDPTACPKCGSESLAQDDDVLDTWFSSGLWPFSTMGWPDKTKDLEVFYPTSLLITGFDILFFWVARMTMLGIEMTGQVPFRKVLIHGLVRDADKQKMSKTKGNVIDPIEMTDKYGTDAVRMALVASAAQGSDVVLTEERIAGFRAFANKIWNAARFLFLSLEKAGAEAWTPEDLDSFRPLPDEESGEVPLADRWIFSRLDEAAARANENIEKFRYHEVANDLYHFFWDDFCDWYIELKKLSFGENTGLTAEWKNMLAAMERALRLLHPVAPFITEELWQRLSANTAGRAKSVALASYPRPIEGGRDRDAEARMAALQEIVVAVRNLRAELNIPPKSRLSGTLFSEDETVRALAVEQADALSRLAGVQLAAEAGSAPEGEAMHHTARFDLALKLPAAETEAVRERLRKQLKPLEKARQSSRRQLANEAFLAKAPPHVVASIRAKLAEYESQIERIETTLANLASESG